MSDAPLITAEEQMKEWLKTVEDPELFLSLVDLGLIYTCKQEGERVDITMTLTSPGCPSADYLIAQVKQRMLEYPGVKEITVAVVFDPKWDPRTMASDECKDKMGIW